MHSLGKSVRFIILLMVNLLFASKSYGQQQLMTSQDYLNPVIYNPAALGEHDHMKVNLHTRRQWVGIQGSPETYILSADGALENKKIGLGVVFYNDITDIVYKMSGGVGYRYKVKISDDDHTIQFGLMANIVQNSIRFDKIRTDNLSDQTLFQNRENRTGFDANAGILYRLKGLKVGFSAFQLIGNNLVYENQIDDKSLSFRFIRHFRGMASYDYNISNKFAIEPRFALKSVQGMPMQIDLGVYSIYNKKLWAGVTWQQKYGVSFALGADVYERYSIGYSYDLALGSIQRYTSGSHEIVLGVKLFRARSSQPQSSNIVTNDVPDEELERLKKISKEQDEEIARLNAENKAMKEELANTNENLAVTNENLANTNENIESQKQEMEALQRIFAEDSASIDAVVRKYSTSLDQLKEPKSRYKMVNNVYIDTTIESEVNAHYYIVLGTFMKYTDARLLQRVLARQLQVETKITSDLDNTFFVYSINFPNAVGVKSRIKRHINSLERKGVGKYIKGDIWIYKMKR